MHRAGDCGTAAATSAFLERQVGTAFAHLLEAVSCAGEVPAAAAVGGREVTARSKSERSWTAAAQSVCLLVTVRIEENCSPLVTEALIRSASLSVKAFMRGHDISRHTDAAPITCPTPVAICRRASILSLRSAAFPTPGAAISMA